MEYDALPGLGHACGHNAHCAMAVLAALSLADLKDRFQGTVYVFGTPAEEAGAKIGMAANGEFDGMSLATMVHNWSGPASISDMDVLSLRCYLMEFKGISAHAVAGPWKGHSALAAARGFLSLIDARRESFTSDVRVNAIITDGGLCPAIQPLLTIGDTFYALHTPEFRDETIKEPAHQAIADGGSLIGSLILRTLTDQSFRKRIYQSYLTQREKKLAPCPPQN